MKIFEISSSKQFLKQTQVNSVRTAFTQTALDVRRAWALNNVQCSQQPQWKEAAQFPDSLFPEEGRCKEIELWAERVGNHGVPLQPTPCLLLSFSLTPRVTAKTHAVRLHLLSFYQHILIGSLFCSHWFGCQDAVIHVAWFGLDWVHAVWQLERNGCWQSHATMVALKNIILEKMASKKLEEPA